MVYKPLSSDGVHSDGVCPNPILRGGDGGNLPKNSNQNGSVCEKKIAQIITILVALAEVIFRLDRQ